MKKTTYQKKLKTYLPPVLWLNYVALESGIATSSITVVDGSVDGTVQLEYDQEDIDGNIIWSEL